MASDIQAADTSWFTGELNHLTEEEELKLIKFKRLCEESGYYKPENEGTAPSYDDARLLYGISSYFSFSVEMFLARDKGLIYAN